jgi:hypothetical protein
VNKTSLFSRLILVGAAWCLLAAVCPASAQDTIPFQFTLGDEWKTVSITVNAGTSWTDNVASGRYRGKFDLAGDGFANDTAFKIFCLDASHAEDSPFETLVANGYVVSPAESAQEVVPGKFYYANIFNEGGGLESAMTTDDYFKAAGNQGTSYPLADRAVAVSYLIDTYLNFASFSNGYTNKQNWASIQLAIWDLIQDGGDGVGVGNFKTRFHSFTGMDTLADSYVTEAKAASPTLFYAKYIQAPRPGADAEDLSDHYQEFAFKSSAPIPEPAFYQMAALLGLGGMGFWRSLRRRRR